MGNPIGTYALVRKKYETKESCPNQPGMFGRFCVDGWMMANCHGRTYPSYPCDHCQPDEMVEAYWLRKREEDEHRVRTDMKEGNKSFSIGPGA